MRSVVGGLGLRLLMERGGEVLQCDRLYDILVVSVFVFVDVGL